MLNNRNMGQHLRKKWYATREILLCSFLLKNITSMASPNVGQDVTLHEHYMLGDGKGIESVEKIEVKIPVDSASENVVTEKIEETPAVTKEATEAAPTAAEEIIEVTSAASQEATPAAKDISEATPDAAEESSNNVEEENSGDQEVEHTSEIKLETAPADFRFPSTNQTRHCFTRYIEYHRCTAVKGEGASECDKFAKFYRSLCPAEWVERWNEQRENGTFPGPL
ncbi:unnamed protein product, partial [Vitis vinifera]